MTTEAAIDINIILYKLFWIDFLKESDEPCVCIRLYDFMYFNIIYIFNGFFINEFLTIWQKIKNWKIIFFLLFGKKCYDIGIKRQEIKFVKV